MHSGDSEYPRDEGATSEEPGTAESETEEMVYVGDVYALVAAAGVPAGKPKEQSGSRAAVDTREETEEDGLWPLIR